MSAQALVDEGSGPLEDAVDMMVQQGWPEVESRRLLLSIGAPPDVELAIRILQEVAPSVLTVCLAHLIRIRRRARKRRLHFRSSQHGRSTPPPLLRCGSR